MTAVLVTALAVCGLAPWSAARGRVGRRLSRLVGGGTVSSGAGANAGGSSRGGGRRGGLATAVLGRGGNGGRSGTRGRNRSRGWSGDRSRNGAGPAGVLDVGVLLALLAAAVRSGASLPRALHAVGRAVGGTDGAALEQVSAALLLGSSWASAWSDAPESLAVVGRALAPAWDHGAAAADALRVAAAQVLADRRAVAGVAAARLGVRLVVPLGVCFLPAFLLIGLVPLLISLGSRVLS